MSIWLALLLTQDGPFRGHRISFFSEVHALYAHDVFLYPALAHRFRGDAAILIAFPTFCVLDFLL